MKIKVNNLKLIVKKEKGGDIPKFKKPSGKINTTNYGIGATARDSSGRIYWEWAKPKSAGYSSAVDRAVARARLANDLKPLVTKQLTILSDRLQNLLIAMRTGNPELKAAALSQYYRDKGDITLANIYAKKAELIKKGSLNSTVNTPKEGIDTSVKGLKSDRGVLNNVPKIVNTSTSSFTNNGTEELTGTFGQAFLEARRRGLTQFNWKGASYGTRMANENNATWRNNMSNAAAKYTATTMLPRSEETTIKPEDTIVEKTTPINTKTTPYTYWYQQSVLNKNPELIRDMLWQATQDVRSGKRNADYYGENSNLITKLATANQDSAKNYIYNLWNTNNDVATQLGRKNYTESLGLTFGESTTKLAEKFPIAYLSNINFTVPNLKDKLKFTFAKHGTKLISKKK